MRAIVLNILHNKIKENGINKMRNNTSERLNFGVRMEMNFCMKAVCVKLNRSLI